MSRSYFFITLFYLVILSVSDTPIFAEEAPSAEKSSDQNTHSQAQPEQDQNPQAQPSNPEQSKPTTSTYNFKEEDLKYINSWIAMRPVIGRNLYDGSTQTISSETGVSYLIFFIASWCTTCKTQIFELKKLQDTHEKLYTKVIYAFSHDTFEDAQSFSKKHDIQKNSILVDDGTIGAYSNPHIPSIFIVDRQSWIIDAYQSLDSENLKDIDEILNLINSY